MNILFLISIIYTRLTVPRIKEALEWRSPDGKYRINEKEGLNPFLGFLVNQTGIVHNKRWLSPEIEPSYKVEDGKFTRTFNGDKSVVSFYQRLIDMFPSSSGTISTIAIKPSSFCYFLDQLENRTEAIRFMAALMAGTMGVKLGMKTTNKKVAIDTSPPIKFESGYVTEIAAAATFFIRESDSSQDGSIEKYLTTKNFLLQAFLFHFLKSKDDVIEFFNELYSIVEDDDQILQQYYLSANDTATFDYSFFNRILSATKSFPFTALNPPQT
jgi:hypothetical protein